MKKIGLLITLVLLLGLGNVCAGDTIGTDEKIPSVPLTYPNFTVLEDMTEDPYALAENGDMLRAMAGIFEKYEDIRDNPYNPNVFGVKKNGLWGIIDKDGNMICEPQFKSVSIGGYEIRIMDAKDKYGFLDENGKMIVEPKYDYTGDGFFNGVVVVGRDFGYTVIDKSGRELFDLVPYELTKSRDGNYFSYKKDGRIFVVDKNNTPVGECNYDEIYIYNKDLVIVTSNNRMGVTDVHFNVLIAPKEYKYITYQEDRNIFIAEKEDKICYLKLDGSLIGGREWEKNPRYYDGGKLLLIEENNKYGYMDSKGNILVPPIFEQTVGNFVKLQGRVGIVDDDGTYLVEPKWNLNLLQMRKKPNGYTVIQKNNKYGLLDRNGKVIIEPIFEYIEIFDHEYNSGDSFLVIQNGRIYRVKLVPDPTPMSEELLTQGVETPEADYLVQKGILQGNENGELRLWDMVTRAEFVALLSRANQWECVDEASNFTDIQNHWAKKYIVKATKEKLLKGFDDGTFRPDALITMNQAFLILLRQMGVSEEYIDEVCPIVAGEQDAYMIAGHAKIAPAGSYLVHESATRENIAKLIYNYLHTDMTPEEIYKLKPKVQVFIGS